MNNLRANFSRFKLENLLVTPLLYACGAGAAGLIALIFGGSFSSTLPVIAPFFVANQAPDIPSMVIFPFHSDIQAAALSRDNTKLFVADRFNNVVQVIDLKTKQKVKNITVGLQSGVDIANLQKPPDTERIAGIRPTNIILSPVKNANRAFIAAQTSDEEAVRDPGNFGDPTILNVINTLTVVDTNTLQVVETYAVGTGPLGLAITPDGKKVYVANSGEIFEPNQRKPSNSVSIVNTTTKEVKTIEIGNFPTYLIITPDGKKVYVTHSGTDAAPGQFVAVIDVETDLVLPVSFSLDAKPAYITVSPDGSAVLVANTGTSAAPGNTISVIDVVKDTLLSVTVGSMPVGIAVVQEVDENGVFLTASDNNRVIVANAGDDTVSVISAGSFNSNPTGDQIEAIAVGSHPTALAVTNDGEILFVANSGQNGSPGNTVSVVEAKTANVIARELQVTSTKNASPIGILVENNTDNASSDSHRAFVINNFSVSFIEETTPDNFLVSDTVFTIKTGPTKLASIQFDPGNPDIKPTLFIANASEDKVYIINSLTDTVTADVEVDSTPVDMAVTNDRKKLLIANSGFQKTGGNSITVVDIERAESSQTDFSNTIILSCINAQTSEAVECRPTSVVATGDDSRAFVANFGISSDNDFNNPNTGSSTISVIDISDADVTDNVEAAAERIKLANEIAPLKIAISSDNNTLFVITDGFDGALLSIDRNNPDNQTDEVFEGTFIDLKLTPPNPGQSFLATSFYDPASNDFEFPPEGVLFTTNQKTTGITIQGNPTLIQLSESNDRVYVISSGTMANPDNKLSILKLDGTGTPPSLVVDVGARPIDLAIFEDAAPNTDKVYIANIESNTVSVVEVTQNNGNLSIISNNTINSTGTFPIDAPIDIEIVQVAADKTKAYVANSGNNTITVIDVETDSVINTIDLN